MKSVTCILMLVMLRVCAAGAERMTAGELDALVDRAVRSEHPDFVQVCIDELKAAGRLTEPELAEAFHRAVMRYRDRKEDEARLNCSMYWLVKTLPENQLGKLRDLALSHSGTIGELAVWGYFKRIADNPACLESLAMVLDRNPALRNAVWRQLFAYLEGRGRMKSKSAFFIKVLNFAEERAEGPWDAWACDYILSHYLSGYASSAKRKDRLARILEKPELQTRPQTLEYFRQELGKIGNSGK